MEGVQSEARAGAGVGAGPGPGAGARADVGACEVGACVCCDGIGAEVGMAAEEVPGLPFERWS